jgi:predicted dehydrogenase
LEKPVELDTRRAALAVDAAAEAGVTLAMVLQFRHRESSRALAGLIAERRLGEIAAACVTAPWWRPQSYYDEPGRGTLARDGGGVLMTQAIHVLDLFQSLVGGIASVSAVAATSAVHEMECEDFAAAGLELGNGAPGSLVATTTMYPGFGEKIEIIGTAATAVLAGEVLDIHYRDGGKETVGAPAKTGGGADPMDFPHDGHRAVMRDYLDALDEERAPLVSGAEALKVHRIIDAILESAATGTRVSVAD